MQQEINEGESSRSRKQRKQEMGGIGRAEYGGSGRELGSDAAWCTLACEQEAEADEVGTGRSSKQSKREAGTNRSRSGRGRKQ